MQTVVRKSQLQILKCNAIIQELFQLGEVSNDVDTKICRRLEWFRMKLINQESISFRKLPTSAGSGIERHHGNSAPTPNTVYAFHLASIPLANARNPRRNGLCIRCSTSVFCWATVKFLHRSLIMYMRRIDVGCRVCRAFCIEVIFHAKSNKRTEMHFPYSMSCIRQCIDGVTFWSVALFHAFIQHDMLLRGGQTTVMVSKPLISVRYSGQWLSRPGWITIHWPKNVLET